MEITRTQKMRTLFGKRIPKFVLIGVPSLIILGAIAFVVVKNTTLFSGKSIIQQRTTMVQKGSISVKVTGSGPINSSNESQVTSSVTGKITKIYFKEGDSVKAGDLMFELDDSDAKLNVEKIKNSIAQAKLTVDTNTKSVNGLSIRAPYDGQVTNIATLKVGDEINKGATILTITDTSKLKLNVAFSSAIIGDIKTGKTVTVNIQDLMQSVEGTITYVSGKPSTTSSGGSVYDVEITLRNPGSLKAGMSASAEVDTKSGSQTSTGTGGLEYLNTQIIKSVSGGTVTSVNVKENQFVKAGQSLVQMINDDLEVSTETNDLKMQDLENQLQTAEKQLLEYKIYAPIDGIIVSQDLKVGNSVKPADILTVITDPKHMEFEVSVDELDISKIKVGQEASITVDALTDTTEKPLSGRVSKIAIEGSSSNGVTTYPVTISVNETESLKVGMNANAEITIEQKSDILVVPLEAIQKNGNKSFVKVLSSGGNPKSGQMTQGNPPNGQMPGQQSSSNNSTYVLKPVEIGINNDEYVEITSGLNEGDIIVLPALTTGSGTAQTTQQQMGGGMMGMMGGGMPAGGPPSGGQDRQSGSSSSSKKN